MTFNKIKLFLLSKILGRGGYSWYCSYIYNLNKRNYKTAGKNISLIAPLFLYPKSITLESNIRIQGGVRIITSPKQDVIIKQFAAIGANSILIPGNHTPTVGVPQYLSYLGINDINSTLVINEDAWIGANSILLSKAQIGRGAIIAGGSVVTKEVPPYAVVGGSPSKIIAVRFSVEQIIEHEKKLYPQELRLSEEFLKDIFNKYYLGLKTIGISDISDNDINKLQKEKNILGIL